MEMLVILVVVMVVTGVMVFVMVGVMMVITKIVVWLWCDDDGDDGNKDNFMIMM